MHKKPGYILLMTLMILAICIVLVTYMFNKGIVNVPYSYTMIQREKAKLLAISGIEIAVAQLAKKIEIKMPQQTGQTPQDLKAQPSVRDQADKEFLRRLLPVLNQWQTFDLKEDQEGVDGSIKICIMSEDGKVNINQIYDFKKHEFFGGEFAKQWLKTHFKNIGLEESFDKFNEFLKKRTQRLDDPTELLVIPGFEIFKDALFYDPQTTTKKQIYLTDLFTVWSTTPQIEPWLFSPAVLRLLDLKKQDAPDIETRKKNVESWVKNFKSQAQYASEWDKIMKPIYGKDFTSLVKGIEFILNPKFDPKVFSVLSYGKIGEITQKMLAIVERVTQEQNTTVTSTVKIKKVYWL